MKRQVTRTVTYTYKLPNAEETDRLYRHLSKWCFGFSSITALGKGNAVGIMDSNKSGLFQVGTLRKAGESYEVVINGRDKGTGRLASVLKQWDPKK